MKRIGKEDIYALYGKNSKEAKDNLITKIISSSNRFYMKNLGYENYQNMRLFPWKGWTLFGYLKDSDMLDKDNELCATSVLHIASNYNMSNVKEDVQTRSIEAIKERLVNQNDFINKLPYLAIVESGKPKIIYLIDGYHRMIAYQSLIKEGRIKPKRINFIIGEVPSVKVIGPFNIMFSMLHCSR